MIRFFIDWWRDDNSRRPVDAGEPKEHRRRRSERGQSLVEYCILLTWTCLAMMAMVNAAGKATHGIWTTANKNLSQANVTAS
ncbi:MAG TPA: hypothetical protein VLW65_06745 [Bryobacteraceae bacterium]|nr:hypothetical protein [Bryobacteraceae bacterium]